MRDKKGGARDLWKVPYVLVSLVALWYILDFFIDSPVIPPPHRGIARFIELLPTISLHLGASLLRILVALGVTLVVGYPLGVMLGRSDRFDAFITPIIYGVYPIPKVAFLPVLMVLFGIGNTARVTLIFLILTCQVIISVRDSVKQIPYAYFRSIKMLGGSRWDTMYHLIFPASLPRLLTSVKIGVGTGLSVLFFAENFGTTWGIGFYIMHSWMRISYVDMFAGIIGVSLLGMVLFWILTVLERKLCAWSKQ